VARVHLLGYVYPAEPRISWDSARVPWVAPELQASFEFALQIRQNKIDVTCRVRRFRPEYLVHIHKRAYDLCRAAVNLEAFSLGCAWVIVLDRFVNERGVKTPFKVLDPSLPQLCTAYSNTDGFGDLYSKVIERPTLIKHLSELIRAISVPHDSTLSCARALAGLKELFEHADADEDRALERMRQALRIDAPYLNYVTGVIRAAHNGHDSYVVGEASTESTRRAWTIMNRYFEYLKRGEVPLPEGEFPTLTG
jgi:hypothetical protein